MLPLFENMIFANINQLRIQEREDYPGLSGWTANAITGVLTEKPEKEITKTEEEEAL